MPSAFDGYGPRERVPTKVVCRECRGVGLIVTGGRTPEGDVMDDVECPTCKGTGSVIVDL